MITALSSDEDAEDGSDRAAQSFSGNMVIPFKNENLYAEQTANDGRITVPTFSHQQSNRRSTDRLTHRCWPLCLISYLSLTLRMARR